MLAEGRNLLLAAAAAEELRRGTRYTYYAMLDADTVAVPPWHVALPRFEAFLADWLPAVGVPTLDYGDPFQDSVNATAIPESVCSFDHIFLAVHAEAAVSLLPYDAENDSRCRLASQWKLTAIASALFRNHVLMLPSVRVLNPVHSKYRKDDCLQEMISITDQLRERAPPAVRSCFPELSHYSIKFRYGAYRGTLWKYSWGTAHRKNNGDNYAAVAMDTITPCDDEDLVQILESPFIAAWCRGCDTEEAFFSLQAMTASRPWYEANWNALGVWIREMGSEVASDRMSFNHFLWTSAGCFEIAQRLVSIAGKLPHKQIADNLAVVGDQLMQVGISWSGERLWEDEGAMARQIINVAMLGQTHNGNLPLMEGSSLDSFVEYLAAGA